MNQPLGRSRQERIGFAGEMAKNDFASRNLYEVERRKGEQDEYPIREPRIQLEQVKTFGHTVNMQKLEDIEVQQVEAVATLAYK